LRDHFVAHTGRRIRHCDFRAAHSVRARPTGWQNIPAKTLPVPTVDVSPEIQKVIALPLRKDWDLLPKTGEEWKPIVEALAAGTIKNFVPGLREKMMVKYEPVTIDGVKAFVVTPEKIAPGNENRVIIHMHGGCYVLSPGEAALPEALR
jgi:epsilon-lactone hydrolase